MQDGSEIILNLWFVQDPDGVIYSLRARAYLSSGSAARDLAFLRQHAEIDHRIASVFPVPDRYHTMIGDRVMPVALRSAIDTVCEPLEIFEDAIRALGDALPAQSNAAIPTTPLVCITTLVGVTGDDVMPVISGTKQFTLPETPETPRSVG